MIAVTILAFVFVPASLSTSVFGMNLRELGSPPVWVFVVTLLAVFGGTFTLWVAVYQFNLAIHVPRAKEPEGEPLTERLKYLAWLISRFHLIFLFRSGIWLSLLTDGDFGFVSACDDPECLEYAQRHHSNQPCDYIDWHHTMNPNKTAFRGVYSNR